MFLSKYFGQKPSDISRANVCILQLTYDFEERLQGASPSLPIISSHITITGLTLDLRELLAQAFPQVQHNLQDEFLFLQTEDGDLKNSRGAPAFEGTLPKVMKSVTNLLSFLVLHGFKIVTCTVDSSSSGGYTNKNYCWTLQQK